LHRQLAIDDEEWGLLPPAETSLEERQDKVSLPPWSALLAEDWDSFWLLPVQAGRMCRDDERSQTSVLQYRLIYLRCPCRERT